MSMAGGAGIEGASMGIEAKPVRQASSVRIPWVTPTADANVTTASIPTKRSPEFLSFLSMTRFHLGV
jgi:hypothetical protein